MPQCQTRYFGEVEYGSGSVVEFCDGLPGFEDERRFILIEWPDLKPLVFVQSLATPGLCFPTLSVVSLDPDYRLEIEAADRAALGLASEPAIGREVACLAILNIRETETVANLAAPLVIDLKSRRAIQAVVGGSSYSHEYPFSVAEPAEAAC